MYNVCCHSLAFHNRDYVRGGAEGALASADVFEFRKENRKRKSIIRPPWN
jgi:hypothetical protein